MCLPNVLYITFLSNMNHIVNSAPLQNVISIRTNYETGCENVKQNTQTCSTHYTFPTRLFHKNPH